MRPQALETPAVPSIVTKSAALGRDATERESRETARGSLPTELETDSRVIVIDKYGILRSSCKHAADHTLSEAKIVVRSMGIVGGGIRRPVLVDFRGIRSMDREARAYFSGSATEAVASATAILVESALEKAIGQFFMGANKPLVPTRLYTLESHAMAWLRTYLP